MLPEYLPGIHPLLIHFPIALLVSAVVVDLVAVVARHELARRAATWLLLAGTAFLPLTYWTGRHASDRVASPFPRAEAVMAEHADLAWWTLWVFITLAVFRLVLATRDRLQGRLHIAFAGLLVAATILLGVTADHGGQLVFDLGVGVRPVREAPTSAFEPAPEPDPAVLGPTVDADGTLRWSFQEGAAAVLDLFLEPLDGQLPAAAVETQQAALVLTKVTPERTVLRLGDAVDTVSMKMRVRRDGFAGTIGLGLHANDAATLDYLVWDGSTLTLGVRRDGRDEALASAPTTTANGWHEIELVATGTHFRGYIDGELLLHEHADAAPIGPAAILLEGTGKVRLDDIRITPINE